MENLKPPINSIFFKYKNLNYCEMIINDGKPTYITYQDFIEYIKEYIDEESNKIIIKTLVKKWQSFIFFVKNQKIIYLKVDIDTAKKNIKTNKIVQKIKTEIENKHLEFYKKNFDPKEKVKNIWKKNIYIK